MRRTPKAASHANDPRSPSPGRCRSSRDVLSERDRRIRASLAGRSREFRYELPPLPAHRLTLRFLDLGSRRRRMPISRRPICRRPRRYFPLRAARLRALLARADRGLRARRGAVRRPTTPISQLDLDELAARMPRAMFAMIGERSRLGADELRRRGRVQRRLSAAFREARIPCLGIEPTAEHRGSGTSARRIAVLREFFGVALAERLAAEGKRPI